MIKVNYSLRKVNSSCIRFLSTRMDELKKRLAEDEAAVQVVNKGSKKSLPKPKWLKAVRIVYTIRIV
jgi:hypothetical protein